MAASGESRRRRLSFPGTVRGPTKKERICELCQQHHHQLSSPLKWRSEEARKYVVSQQVKRDSLICKPCQDDITRVVANPGQIPRWRKGAVWGNDHSECCIHLCSKSVFVNARLANTEQMQAAFGGAGLQSCTVPIPKVVL